MSTFARGNHQYQKGQALAIVLALLAIGGLTIAVNLNYATTSLKGAGIATEGTKGVYAASAGVEQSLWALNRGVPPPTSTPENINGMAVTIDTQGSQSLTLFLDDLVLGVHADRYIVTSNITPAGGNTCNYTITLTTTADASNNKKLAEFGALLPPGYTYVSNSAATWHATNLSTQGSPAVDNPTSTGTDAGGSLWLKWSWGSGHGPSTTSSTTYTQKFQINGTGSTWGSYAWIVGQSSDIGTVGQITGVLTTITATARRPQDNKITGKVVAEAIVGGGGVYVFSWKESKQ